MASPAVLAGNAVVEAATHAPYPCYTGTECAPVGDVFTKFVTGDVPRYLIGYGADRVLANTFKTQGAMQALTLAGITGPTAAVPKATGLAQTVVTTGSTQAYHAYTRLPYNALAPFTGAVSTIRR